MSGTGHIVERSVDKLTAQVKRVADALELIEPNVDDIEKHLKELADCVWTSPDGKTKNLLVDNQGN